jgi:hypothetical protein
MTDTEPESETQDPAELRSAALEALQSAVRQSDPREFDRLTRYALGLIDRARAIGRGRQRAAQGAEVTSDVRKKDETAEKEASGMPRNPIPKFIRRLWRPRSR